MNRTIVIAGAVAGMLLFGHWAALAQGKGNGLNRGLSSASKGISGSTLSRSGGPLSRASSKSLRSGASMGRASSGLERANAAAAPSIEMPTDPSGSNQALTNQQSILEHRLDQADHLRSLSQSNGNQHLLDTADRMEANANRNFQRQQTRLAGGGTGDNGGSTTPATGSDDVTSGSPNPTATPAAGSQPRRGLWFRSR